jgi:hypothetical protein
MRATDDAKVDAAYFHFVDEIASGEVARTYA